MFGGFPIVSNCLSAALRFLSCVPFWHVSKRYVAQRPRCLFHVVNVLCSDWPCRGIVPYRLYISTGTNYFVSTLSQALQFVPFNFLLFLQQVVDQVEIWWVWRPSILNHIICIGYSSTHSETPRDHPHPDSFFILGKESLGMTIDLQWLFVSLSLHVL